MGLQKLILKDRDFDISSEELIKIAEQGDAINCDLTVGDIYGDNCESLGLDKNITAASFGKPLKMQEEKCKEEDYIKSLAKMFCINVGNLTGLVARAEDVKGIMVTLGLYKSENYNALINTLINYYLGESHSVESIVFSKDSEVFCNLGATV